MIIAKVIAHQDYLESIIVCRYKKGNCATSAICVCRKNGTLCTSKCHRERGVNTLCALCEIEE
jgi:hypothetical protein